MKKSEVLGKQKALQVFSIMQILPNSMYIVLSCAAREWTDEGKINIRRHVLCNIIAVPLIYFHTSMYTTPDKILESRVWVVNTTEK